MQSVSTVVLARLLTPADFGLVAMVTTITGLAQGFADLGLSEATIQREQISHHQVSNLFWINVSVGLALMMATAASAPVLAWFYREPRLKDVTLLLSLTFLIGGLRVQHYALLQRQMRFVAMAIRDVGAYVIAVPAAIIMAWRGAGYWAIVALPLILSFTATLLSWLMVRWIPDLPRRDAKVGSLLAFGGNVAASYFMLNVNRSADTVLIGRYWGAGPLGLYSRAYNLLMQPVRQLYVPVGSVAIPALSRLQNDPERFARYFLRTINLMAWICAPVFGFLFVTAEPMTVLVLGHQWREAAPVFQILVVSALGQLLFGSTLWVFVSRGQSGRLLKLTLITSPAFICSYLMGLPFGIKGVALTGSLVLLAMLPWILKYTFRETRLTLWRLGQAMLYPTSLCLGGVFLAELGLHFAAPHHMLSQLLVVALGFITAYLLSALIPSVRAEARSLQELFSELRMPSPMAQKI
jgi:PST family polysaccharide transporter